jgi:hypothetical protein
MGQLYPWFAVTGQLIFGKELVGYVSTKVNFRCNLSWKISERKETKSVLIGQKKPTSLILSRALWLAEQIQPPLFF